MSTTRAPSTRVDRARRSRSQCSGSAASTVMSRTMSSSSTSTRSTAPIVAARLADRAGHPARACPGWWAISTRMVRRVLGGRGAAHRRREHTRRDLRDARVRRVAVDGAQPDELFLIDGNSLAYRAFFALPESIATSTGFPTNAIFGFASMLVKILTELRHEADGRRLGRRARPGARRSTPSTRRTRTLAARPAQASSGRTSSRSSRRSATATSRVDGLRGRRRHRLDRRARAATQGVPVMVVTGDRDAFQLIDPESRVQGDGDRRAASPTRRSTTTRR